MFGVNPLAYLTKFNSKCFSDYDSMVDLSNDIPSIHDTKTILLKDYFSAIGTKSILFFMSYMKTDDVEDITITLDTGFSEGQNQHCDHEVQKQIHLYRQNLQL